tara:strand:+ start:367 stop:2286 length:1920 start_codon:yes stop_codon:yes gene_type:complete
MLNNIDNCKYSFLKYNQHRIMRINKKLITFVLSLFLITSCSFLVEKQTTDSNTLRKIESGEIIGMDNGETYQWLGIPYGSVPDSNYRWKKAKQPSSWDGVKEVIEFGEFCTQRSSLINSNVSLWANTVGSEDCLNLNIWSPKANENEILDSKKYPVMVWIHGGSNMSGNSDFYNPMQLVKNHDVIVVTINYRLGPFGWFNHPSINKLSNKINSSGNYGNLDTIQALEWVQTNIDNFGGDKNNVTIFGESAGGYNVAALLSSPIALGLFHKAIIQSGGVKPGDIDHAQSFIDKPLPWKNYTSKELFNQLLIIKKMAKNRKDALKVQSEMNDETIDVILRSASTEDIYLAYLEAKINTNEMLRPFPDGTVLYEGGIMKALKNGMSADIPVIFGTNRDENKLFLIENKRLTRSIFGLPFIKDINYYNAVSKHRSNTWKLLAVDQPARDLANLNKKSIYAYRFDWDEEPKKYGIDLSNLLGAAHAFEIPFVMGDFEMETLSDYMVSRDNLDGMQQLSNAMMSYWAEFAYNGDPGKGRSNELPIWNAWSEINDESPRYMIFDSYRDRGIRMTNESLTKELLFAQIAEDEDLDIKYKCELVDIAIKYDDLENEEFLFEFNQGLCKGLNPDLEWRQYWYEEMDEPW